MLRHIVMFKFKNRSTKNEEALKVKEMLENLKDAIPSILTLEVGINMSSRASASDLVLIANFENEAGLEAYRMHPSHLEVVNYLKGVKEYTSVVDYILQQQ